MLKNTFHVSILIIAALVGLWAQTNWTISFLRELMRDPSKVASQEEALKQIEDIKLSSDVKRLVPIVFEAVNSRNLQAQSMGATALYAIAMRPDGGSVLSNETDSILKLLANSEPRLQRFRNQDFPLAQTFDSIVVLT